MFLFLSKLLPLFIYPLGLTCLLLLGTLVLLWKSPRLAAIPILLSLVLLLTASNTYVAGWLLRSLEFQNLPLAEIPPAEAIVVLGGALDPYVPPRPWIELREEGDRVVYAAKLYRDGKAPRMVLSGGRVAWTQKFVPESVEMAELVQTMGVPKTAILQDPTSLNTRENAVNVKKILDTEGIKRVLLVTSALHMPRSLLIFKRLGIDVTPAPTDFLSIKEDPTTAVETLEGRILNLLPDAENLYRTTRVFKEYIGIWVYRLRGWA